MYIHTSRLGRCTLYINNILTNINMDILEKIQILSYLCPNLNIMSSFAIQTHILSEKNVYIPISEHTIAINGHKSMEEVAACIIDTFPYLKLDINEEENEEYNSKSNEGSMLFTRKEEVHNSISRLMVFVNQIEPVATDRIFDIEIETKDEFLEISPIELDFINRCIDEGNVDKESLKSLIDQRDELELLIKNII